MKTKQLLFSILSLLILSNEGRSQSNNRSVDQYITDKMEEYRIPGLSVLVIQNGAVIKKSNYGLANIEFNIPVTDSTVFQLASVTKIFTSTIIMKLAEAGKLDLDQPVTAFLDSLPESWRSITIKHLLNHTSGIKNHFQTSAWNKFRKDAQDKLSVKQVIQCSIDEPLMFTPGEKWSYSVTGYIILGMIVHKVTGKPIEVIGREILYGPLNMTNTQYGDYRAVIKNRSSLVYTYQNGPFETWNFAYGLSGTTAAGLNTTTSDLAEFFIALDAGKILALESMDKMMAPTVLTNGTKKQYGLGWTVSEHNNKFAYGHEGGGCCWIDYYRKEHFSIVIVCNLTGSKADEIIKGVAGFYLK